MWEGYHVNAIIFSLYLSVSLILEPEKAKKNTHIIYLFIVLLVKIFFDQRHFIIIYMWVSLLLFFCGTFPSTEGDEIFAFTETAKDKDDIETLYFISNCFMYVHQMGKMETTLDWKTYNAIYDVVCLYILCIFSF